MSDHGSGIRADDIRPGTLLDGGWRVIGTVSEKQWDGARFRVRSESTGSEACLFVPAGNERLYVTKVLDKYRAWNRLPAHPHILSCLEVLEAQDTPMLLYEWTEGRDLADITDDQSLRNCPADAAAARVMDAAIQSLRGLQFLHERGWVHADVKPENMQVTRDGILKLDKPGLLRGSGMTPAFASPEQMQGRCLPASDLYSWAVSLLYLTLGKLEWQKAEGLSEQTDRVMDLLVSAPVTLPTLMMQLIAECLSAQPEMRPKDVRLTLLMLEKIYRGRFKREYSTGSDLKQLFPANGESGDPGATVFAPAPEEKPADPGATVFAPPPEEKPADPGATVFAPDTDTGKTVTDPGSHDKKPPAGGLDDLLAGLESAARDRLRKDSRKPEPESEKPKPASGMDDLLAGLEKQARQRMETSSAKLSGSPAAKADPQNGPAGPYKKDSLLLDTYRIESDPINGGMGSVWRVRHTDWNTDLAMKRPQPQMFADDASKQNFINECQSWINLGLHPNIVSCYYVREIDGVPAIFSEWMENGSLENHIQKATLYEGDDDQIQSRLLDIAIQYARGLHYAHEQGLIHQDVKPDNLLLTKDWQAKAADFGLAKARAVLTMQDQPENDGATHMAAGGGYTPAYCSMEQMDGKPLTRRTDIYSWAVSVMEMYLGGRPWQNGVVAGMSCRSYFDECRVKMPEKLRDLLEKCLDSDPEKRPHDFAVVEEELKKIYRDTLKSDYPRSAPKAAPDTADSLNNRALSYLDLGMPLQADALWQKAKFADPSNAEALFNSLLHAYRDGACSFNDAQESLAQISKVNDQGYVYSARLALEHGPEGYDLAARIAAIQNDPSLEEDLKETDRAGHYRCAYVLSRLQSLPDLEKREQRYDERARQIRELIDAGRYDDASALMMESINPASGYTGCIYRPEWMALNDRLSRRGFPVFMRVAFPLLTVRDTQFDDPISFSSDSSLLLSGGRLYNMATGELIRDHRTAEGKAMFSALSPDGTFLLRAEENSGAIRKIDARDGSVLESYDPFQAPLQALALSPDGTAFAGIDKNTGFCFWKDGKKVLEGRFDPGHVRNLRISYDNKQVTFIVDNSICLMNVESGKAQTLNIPFANLLNYTVNTAFTRLVACGDRDGYILYDLENKKTILQESLKTVQMRVMNIVSACFLPNDRYIAYSSLREIYPFAPEQHKWIMGFMAAYSLVVNLAFSSNWKYMAFRSNEGDVKIWRCAYMYFVPPGQEKGESERAAHYARFSRAMMSDPSSAAAAPRDSLFRSFEEVFTDMKAVRVFAAVRHSADPSKTADQLLPGMMEELRDRGFGSVGEKQVLEMLRGICPSSRTASAPAGMNDLMSALENAARDRMRKEDPKPAPTPEKPKPSSGMDDLLAALEKQARQRMGKSGPDAGKPKPADDPGATVYAPSDTSDAPEADPGKTIMEPAPDPGKTVMEPDDPGRTVPGPADPGKTVPGPESGRTAVVPADDGKTVLESAAPGAPSPSPEQSPEKPAVPSFEKGSLLLDTYRIESDPINGGMGSVWRVRHTGWNTDLAMKRPQPQMFSDEISKQNFISECRNWIDLGLHPNIVSCYYVREIDGVPAIFSEWMENGSLENHIQKGTLYEGDDDQIQSRLLDIAIQYARGLHYAHEKGLIHQDVKPDNLLLTKDWQAKAADFGLAKARAVLTVREQPEDKGATHMAASGGYTPAYCSMEQMDGKPLTRRTDIYSWAVSVMEMYLGGRPWQNGVVAGMSCRSYFDECRVKMPEKLRDLLEKCLDSDPEKRPHDFGVIDQVLKAVYRETLENDYPRPEPAAAADDANSMNNRALSYLDLGLPAEAEKFWEKALEKEADSPASLYNRTMYRLQSDPKLQKDGYALAEGMSDLFSKMLQSNNGMPTAQKGELLAGMYTAHYGGSNADDSIRQAVKLSPAGSAERTAREEKAKRIEASWMPLPMVPERCGMIAFDVLDDRCAVVWQQQKDQAGFTTCLAVYSLGSRHEHGKTELTDGKSFKRVFFCPEAIYLCGQDGYSFAAFDPDTLERLPDRDRCDFTAREDHKDWPYITFRDGLRSIQPTRETVWVGINKSGRSVPRQDVTTLWRPKNAGTAGGMKGVSIVPKGDAGRNGMRALSPAMGLPAELYAVSADSSHRWLLVYTQPYYKTQKRYFAVYDLDVFGTFPGYAVSRAFSYAEVYGKQKELQRLLQQAEECRKAENWKEMLSLLDRAYGLDPDRPAPEWTEMNNAAGRSPACRRQRLRGCRVIETVPRTQLPAFPGDPGGYDLSNALPGGSMMLMMALAAGGLPNGFLVPDPSPFHMVFAPKDGGWTGRLESGLTAARVEGIPLAPGAIGVCDTGNSRAYITSAGILSVWDTQGSTLRYLGAMRFAQAVPPGNEKPAGYLDSLPPLEPADQSARWALEPFEVSLNRSKNATVALVQSHVMNRFEDDRTEGLCAVSVIDLRTMTLLHTMFVHNKHRFDSHGASHNIGMDVLMDISPEGDVFLWHSISHHPFLWVIPCPGQFYETDLGSTGADCLRRDGTAYIGMASFGASGEKYRQVVLDWQYSLRDGTEEELHTDGMSEDEFRSQMPEIRKERDPMADLLAGTEEAARNKLKDKQPSPPPAGPKDPMADLLAEMERRARDRIDKKPKK